MDRLSRKLILSLFLLLLPGLASAMVIKGNVISGLPPDTVIEVDFGLGAPSTAETDENGEVKITDQPDDDDPNGLYVPTGNDGTFTVREVGSGSGLGLLTVAGPKVSGSSMAAANERPTSDYRAFVNFRTGYYEHGDLDSSVANGGNLARRDGFGVKTDTDENGYFGGIGLGIILGDGNPWHSEGSIQWHFGAGYTLYEDRKGNFIASGPGITLNSSGKQELDEFYARITMRYHVADSLGINIGLGYSWYEFKDSGSLVRVEDGAQLNSFSNSEDDDAPSFHFSLSYHINDNMGLSFGYRTDLDETGANNDSELEELFFEYQHLF